MVTDYYLPAYEPQSMCELNTGVARNALLLSEVASIKENQQVKVSVMFYGSVVGIVGKKGLELLVPKGTTVGAFVDTLDAATDHRLGELLHRSGLSLLVDGKSLDTSHRGRSFFETDEDSAEVTVCLLPMVAGGS
ncbi:MAG: hypothetical protein HYX94_10265 [Chloroflexi bacterium]|nr:hypothetical protein [Chloroflexota bacterium]